MTTHAKNESAIYRGQLGRRGYIVKSSEWVRIPPIAADRLDVRELDDLGRSRPDAQFLPASLGSDHGNLRHGSTLLVLADVLFGTSDNGSVVADLSMQFHIPRSPTIICRQMEREIYRTLADELIKRLRSEVASVIGKSRSSEIFANHGALSAECLRALKASCEGVPSSTNGRLGVVISSLSIQFRGGAGACGGPAGTPHFDVVDQARRIFDLCDEKGLVELLGPEIVLKAMILLLREFASHAKVRLLAQSPNALVVVPTSEAGVEVGQREIEEFIDQVRRGGGLLSAQREASGLSHERLRDAVARSR